MITEAANELAKAILEKAAMYKNYASMSACEYASSDNPVSKAEYTRYIGQYDVFYKLHSEICQSLHAVEREMQQRNDSTGA